MNFIYFVHGKRISIESKLDNISQVEKLVDEISDQCNLSADLYGKVLIATIEAVNNSIVHGNKFDKEKLVHISFLLQNQRYIFLLKMKDLIQLS